MDKDDITSIIQENYEKLSDEWQSRIPLKKIFILNENQD